MAQNITVRCCYKLVKNPAVDVMMRDVNVFGCYLSYYILAMMFTITKTFK